MLLSNNPQIDAEQLESRLRQLSEFRRRDDAAPGEPPAFVQFEQEAGSAIVALAAAQNAVATDTATPSVAVQAAGATSVTPDRTVLLESPGAQAAPLNAAPDVAVPASSLFTHTDATPMPPSNSEPPPPNGTPSGEFSLMRKLKGLRAWLGNLRHLNSRMASLNARLQAESAELTHLRATVAALVRLQTRVDQLETLAVRIDALERLPGQVQYLNDSALAQHETNRGLFLRLDAQDRTNQGVQDRINWLEALKAGPRLGQLEHLNIATRLNRLDALDISNRLNAWDMTNVANRLHKLDQHKIGERLQKLDAKLKTVLDRNLERDNRIAALVQKFRTVPALLKPAAHAASPAAPEAAPATTLSAADIDQFYVEFEGLFRGAPEEIRERLKVYLPYVEKLAADPNALAIDIGCGRGEWLGLLQEAGVRALGIDSNAAMVALCQERGLRAECADAIAWLQAQPAGSVALISGFHIIEHLPFDTLLTLFDAALKALRPDGMLIFETPNPENLVVGACHFYYDPTHRSPIVPAVAAFMARQRGFARAEILRVNAYPDSYLLEEDSEAAIRINRAFYSAQDFALLAWKSHAA